MKQTSWLLFLFASFLTGCDIAIEDGRYACAEAPQCPPNTYCWTSDQRCHSTPEPDAGGGDVGPMTPDADAASDSRPPADATDTGAADASFTDADAGPVADCGNGSVDRGEDCDDGNAQGGDGCSVSCRQEAGFHCSGQPSICETECGDGTTAGDEICDDGNLSTELGCAYGTPSCAACNATCEAELALTGPYCGDGDRHAQEACDDGNAVTETECEYGTRPCTLCNGACDSELELTGRVCRDGTLDPEEECDFASDYCHGCNLDQLTPLTVGWGPSYVGALSSDGRWLAFRSRGASPDPRDMTRFEDVYLRDNGTGEFWLASRTADRTASGNAGSGYPSVADDGSVVAFASAATDLHPDDTDAAHDIYLWYRETDSLELVSGDTTDAHFGQWPTVSGDGSAVVYQTDENAIHGDAVATRHIVVYDVGNEAHETVTVSSGGVLGRNGIGIYPRISTDGDVVVFQSDMPNLVMSDTNGVYDIFVHVRSTGITTRISVGEGGAQADGPSEQPAISGNGRFVAFTSSATNLVIGDTNGVDDVFVHDIAEGTTARVSLTAAGGEAAAASLSPSVSNNGDVTFVSHAGLVAADTNDLPDAYHRSGSTGELRLLTPHFDGLTAAGGAGVSAITADGTKVMVAANTRNLISGVCCAHLYRLEL